MWLASLADELRVVRSDEDVAYVTKLFEQATGDYVCPRVWTQWLQFALQQLPADLTSPSSSAVVESTRRLFERAIVAVGCHPVHGGDIWDRYRTFEDLVATALADTATRAPPHTRDDLVKAKGRWLKLFTRQLQHPLQGNEKVLEEVKALPPSEVLAAAGFAKLVKDAEKAHAAAQLMLKQRAPLERLLQAVHDRLTSASDVDKGAEKNKLLSTWKA